jgi:hypothetical protein
MEGTWKTKDPITKAVIGVCRYEVDARDLVVAYRHQRGHQSTWAGRDDIALERLGREIGDGGFATPRCRR